MIVFQTWSVLMFSIKKPLARFINKAKGLATLAYRMNKFIVHVLYYSI
jgi:hypothetical protein